MRRQAKRDAALDSPSHTNSGLGSKALRNRSGGEPPQADSLLYRAVKQTVSLRRWGCAIGVKSGIQSGVALRLPPHSKGLSPATGAVSRTYRKLMLVVSADGVPEFGGCHAGVFLEDGVEGRL